MVTTAPLPWETEGQFSNIRLALCVLSLAHSWVRILAKLVTAVHVETKTHESLCLPLGCLTLAQAPTHRELQLHKSHIFGWWIPASHEYLRMNNPWRTKGFVPWNGAGEPAETPSPLLSDEAANQMKMLIWQTNIYTVSLTISARGHCGKNNTVNFYKHHLLVSSSLEITAHLLSELFSKRARSKPQNTNFAIIIHLQCSQGKWVFRYIFIQSCLFEYFHFFPSYPDNQTQIPERLISSFWL